MARGRGGAPALGNAPHVATPQGVLGSGAVEGVFILGTLENALS